MKPHRASVKLAGLYLAIMMAISVFFSINLYRVSVQEFNRDLRGQGAFLNHLPGGFGLTPPNREQFLMDREQSYNHAKNHVLEQLLITNLIILVGGGFLCYYLARRTLKPIEEAHEAQSRFTADASHELRTPIAVMQSEIEVALMDPKLTLAQAKDRLKSNLEELAKLTKLSEGLLRLARLGDNGLEKKDVSLPAVANQAVDRVLPTAEKKRILINIDAKKDIKIEADEASLVEALVAILDNAIKYSPEKTEVKVQVIKESNHVNVQIVDQGIGIKADELTLIFDRFYQADSARSKKNLQGYGLGLAIAKNIVEINGGTILVDSKPGKGSTFTIQLPLKS
ncbi:MAG TPA: HAMP domain-containing sensor histidine kinase [Patescibacteria group bacterium]|nr:HAMP domain-containing sensor histidine kinase [Patescibacteria group bacterium]